MAIRGHPLPLTLGYQAGKAVINRANLRGLSHTPTKWDARLVMYMSRSLPDTTKKQNPYQIVVNNVLWLNGTPYNILWCPCKAAGIPLCWEGGYTSMVTCMLTSLSFCLLSVFSGAVSVRWRDKYDTKSVIRFWSARKRPPNRMNIYMQIAFLSCRKHSRQWSYVQLFARWEQMILEMKMG